MLRVLDIAPPDAYSSLAYPSSVIYDALKRAAVCFHPDKRRRHSPTLGLSMDRIWEMYKEAAIVANWARHFNQYLHLTVQSRKAIATWKQLPSF